MCLAQIDLFHSFSEDELSQFAENVREIEMNEGEVIFEEGDPGCAMYILLEGTIKIFKDKRFITLITPVDYLGEMAIIEHKPRSATAKAVSGVRLLEVSATLFQEYLACQPRSLVSMMATLSRRIRRDTELLAEEFQRANIMIHDMRNRLTAFLLLDLIDKTTLSEESRRYLNIIQASSRELAIMMDEALANAKRLKFHGVREKKSLNGLILDLQQTEFRLHPSLQDKEIILQLAEDMPEFPFYEIDLRRVLVNLMINAGQASQAGSSLQLTTSWHKGYAELLITDHGCGIPEEIQDKIFRPHFTTKSDGNGLGLASCKAIIEDKHHGTLSFISSGNGTTFRVTIPSTEPHETIDH